MTEITSRTWAGIPPRMSAWIGRRQRELSDQVYAADDEYARQQGWEVTKSTGRFGLGTRSYRDPRFDERRRKLSTHAAQVDQRDHSRASTKETGVAR
jgi:hypothetical protein